MPRLNLSALILRPPAQVFDYWANLDTWPRWQSGLRSVVQQPPGPMHAGAALQISGRVAGRPFEGTLAVTRFDAGRRVDLKARGAPVGIDLQVTFAPAGEGTRLTYAANIKAGLLGAVIAPMLGGAVKSELEGYLAALKRQLEEAA